jgi:hypothetical protein
MFFADPARAFANLRGPLRRGGRISFACWRPFPENPWMTVPFAALEVIPPPRRRQAPGPFSFGDPERVRGSSAGGLRGIEARAARRPLALGTSLEDAVGSRSPRVGEPPARGASAPDRARTRRRARALEPHARRRGRSPARSAVRARIRLSD